MEPIAPTPSQLVDQWKEAAMAAELAERLSRLAAESVRSADRGAIVAEEVAQIAQEAARSAGRAAAVAQQAADRAAEWAAQDSDPG